MLISIFLFKLNEEFSQTISNILISLNSSLLIFPLSMDTESNPPQSTPSVTIMFLLRHGQVRSQHWKTMYGTMDVDLSLLGEFQSIQYAKHLKNSGITQIVSSPLKRALFGATKVSEETSAPILIDNGFTELDRGEWTGFSNRYVEDNFPDEYLQIENNPYFNGHKGESFEMLYLRVIKALKKHLLKNANKTFCVVAHYYVVKAILLAASDKSLSKMSEIDVPLASVSKLKFYHNSIYSDELHDRSLHEFSPEVLMMPTLPT